VYVLDPGVERISIFDRDDTYLGDLPADPALVGRSRGLHVDRDGRIWVANTAAGRVVALDSNGNLLLGIPVWPGNDSQPVDVAVGMDGSIFVTDAGLHKLVQFDAGGRRLLAWDIPVANTIDASHLAVDGVGYLYLSKPEPFLVSQLLPNGELVGDWAAMPPGAAPAKPVGIAVDSSGRVWYVDTVSGIVYVIEPDVG
jgi:streptogramin lyase